MRYKYIDLVPPFGLQEQQKNHHKSPFFMIYGAYLRKYGW